MSYSSRPGRSFAPRNSKPAYGRSGGGGGGGNRRRSSYKKSTKQIHSSKFIRVATDIKEHVIIAEHKFSDFDLHPTVAKNLAAKGYEQPTPIQDQAVPAGLRGEDILGIAGTGTGKTAAFGLPIINALLTNPGSCALIVAPTRELAEQIEAELGQLAKSSGIRGALLIGGTNIGRQIRELGVKPQLVVGTPGRILDHVKRGTLKLNRCNLIALDEVDRMLDMGFIDDVTEIVTGCAPERQSFFFSATMDSKVTSLLSRFSADTTVIALQTSSSPSERVHQDVVRFHKHSDKLDKLHEVLLAQGVTKAIIFDETQRDVEALHEALRTRGFSTGSLHGGKSQSQRQRTLAQFKQNNLDILVATDVAARGIDVDNVSHVINYTAPSEYEDYIHRIGRAGRAGKTGYALTFINESAY
ncbi:MAG: DEAD/DEAH box helicase [Candidatus Saccharimonadales bacterium]